MERSNKETGKVMSEKDILANAEFWLPQINNKAERPLFESRVAAGFPSPAEDYIDKKLDLNELLVPHPASTFFVRVEGDSMIGAGIHSGDILVVDRSIRASDGKVIIAVLEGELTVKRFKQKADRIFLVPENDDFEAIELSPEQNFEVWGVVTNVIHKV